MIPVSTTAPKRAVLIRNANAFDFGGAERFVVALAQELIANGWDAQVVTAHKTIHAFATEQRVPVIWGRWWSRQDWSGSKILLAPLYFVWQIRLTFWYVRLFRRLKPSLVHAQGKDDFIAATIAGRLVGARVIWTDHADLKYIYQNVRTPIKNPVGKLVYACSRLAHAITLVSKSERQLVSKALGKPLSKKYQVIYNGITDLKPNAKKRTEPDQKAMVFCATSRLVTAKGIGELIQAFNTLPQERGAYRLWLVGDGPEQKRFKARAGNNPNIVFVGHTNNPLDYVAACDIFVHPSYHEGFSLSIVEAAMLSKPIIACNVGGNPEIIHDGVNGLLVPAKDAKALAAAMQSLATNPAFRTKLAAAARTTYEQNFRFDTIVKQHFLPLYES